MFVSYLCIVIAAPAVLAAAVKDPLTSCSLSEFSCNDGVCISADVICDGRADCADGSDEMGCRMLDKPPTGSCVLPPYPDHGSYVTDIPDAQPGQGYQLVTVNVTCQPGYGVDGSASTYCFNGVWLSSVPNCVQYAQVTLDGNELVIGGVQAKKELPWHAGIYKRSLEPYMQIYGWVMSRDVVISGETITMSGRNLVLSGNSVVISGSTIYLSRSSVTISGDTVTISGNTIIMSDNTIALSCNTGIISGNTITISGGTINKSGYIDMTGNTIVQTD